MSGPRCRFSPKAYSLAAGVETPGRRRMATAFASQADLADKKESFVKLSDNAYCLTAEGDPNTGVIVGEDGVMVIDTRATPSMAEDVIRHVREVTEKRVK